MAHEIAFFNGKAQAFSTEGGEWHGLCDKSDRSLTLDDAINRYTLDYPLEKLPYFRPLTDPNPAHPSGYVEAGDSFYIWRSDIKKSLGTVGSSYEIVTNRAAFDGLRPLLDGGVATIETGGVLRDGADAWLLVRWAFDSAVSNVLREALGDEVVPYSAVLANHSGRRGVLLGTTPIRIVCANTLGAAETDGESNWMTIPHFSGANKVVIAAAETMFANVLEKYKTIAAQYKLLKGCILSVGEFNSLVLDNVAPDPRLDKKFNPTAKLAELVVARADKKRAAITDLWTTGKGHTGELNAWFAYNAATEAIDHHDELWAKRDGSWSTRSLMSGVYVSRKQAVINALVEHAQALVA